MWDEQFPVFAQQYQAIRYDLRGFGKSRFPAGRFADYEDPVALLRFLSAEKAHVIGVSFGGKIALDFTLTHPEMVASLILVAPSVGGYPPSPSVVRFNEEEEALLEQNDLEAATELNMRMWVDGPKRTSDQVNAAIRRRIYDMQYHAFTVPQPESTEEIVLQPPAIARLKEISVPTLIIVGDYDLPDKLSLAEELVTVIPNAQRIIIPGGGHMVTMEQPEAFNIAVLAFLSKQ
jgi:pimeloyl-ACP methyl ester carboxylesterase